MVLPAGHLFFEKGSDKPEENSNNRLTGKELLKQAQWWTHFKVKSSWSVFKFTCLCVRSQ
jgi:hypothetical protein